MPGERFIVGASESSPEDENSVFGDSCQDITGRTISGGNHYVPGPDSCTVCLCDGGKPKWCQAVLCAAPKDCKSFRIGSSCCEFICLDNAGGGQDEGATDVTWGDGNWVGGDLGLRLVATAVTAVLSLALLAFLFYRLKRRRVRRLSGCQEELEGEGLPSSSMASFEHGDLTSSTGHLSRQPPPLINMNEHQSPVYLMWKLPTPVTDNPPPYTETPNHPMAEDEHQETTGLLTVPSAPIRDMEDETTVVLVRRSNGTLDSEFLDAGTPPPSYAEVLACISTVAVDQVVEEDTPVSEPEGDQRLERRLSSSLPRERAAHSDAAIQRFSLQLALDCSDTSSCSSSTLSHARPLSTSSSSSAASLAHHLGTN